MRFARTITPNQSKTTCDSLPPYFCIFILSSCESIKKLLKTCIHLLLSSTAEPGSGKCAKTSLEPTLLIPLFPITKTCRALVWDLLAILPRDWSYTGRSMVVSPRVTEALSKLVMIVLHKNTRKLINHLKQAQKSLKIVSLWQKQVGNIKCFVTFVDNFLLPNQVDLSAHCFYHFLTSNVLKLRCNNTLIFLWRFQC